MKKFVLLFLLLAANASAKDIYVSPLGYDANAGTLNSPYQTIHKAITVYVPGDAVFARGGAYNLQEGSGLIQLVNLLAYQNEIVTLSVPGGNPVELVTGVKVWTNTDQPITTQPDVAIVLKPGGKLKNVRITRRKADSSETVFVTVNNATVVTVNGVVR